LWALALPVYWLWQWYFSWGGQFPANLHLPEFQYEHQLWTALWAAVGALLGTLFGVKSSY
jgi:hypothetical protein